MGRLGFHEDHTNHPILVKHDKLLTELSTEDQVFDIRYDEKTGSFTITEQCDEYYKRQLSKNDCIELAELFAEIANTFK